MQIKTELQDIIGKTITGILVTDNVRVPQRQVFLVFSDNTHYELYSMSGDLCFTSKVHEGAMAAVERAAAHMGGSIVKFTEIKEP